MSSIPWAVKVHRDVVYIGLEEGIISVYQHLGRGCLVKKKDIRAHTHRITGIDTDDKYFITGSYDKLVKVSLKNA